MSARDELTAIPEVDAAIMRVLAAEQAARVEVEQCARAAQQRVEAAQQQAHAISERAARRVARIHRWTDAAIARRLAELQAERARLLENAHTDAEPASFEQAVSRLADQLAGSAQ